MKLKSNAPAQNYLKPAGKDKGKRMPSGPAPSFTETIYACGDGTPGNNYCVKRTYLKKRGK